MSFRVETIHLVDEHLFQYTVHDPTAVIHTVIFYDKPDVYRMLDRLELTADEGSGAICIAAVNGDYLFWERRGGSFVNYTLKSNELYLFKEGEWVTFNIKLL